MPEIRTGMIAMVNIYIIILSVLILKDIQIGTKGQIQEASLAKTQTERLKGLCAVLIMLHHISQHGYYAFPFSLFSRIGCLVVAIFFFLSGYGMSKSYSADKIRFEKRFVSRIWNLSFPYLIMLAMTVLESNWNGNRISFRGVAENLRYGGVIGNWFFYSIIFLYCVFQIVFCKLTKVTAKGETMLLVCIWTANAVVWYAGWNGWWYNATLAFAVGSIAAFWEREITTWLGGYRYTVTGGSLVMFYIVLRIVNVHFPVDSVPYFLSESLASTVFAMIAMLLNMKVRVMNSVWNFLGSISYEIFLLHAVFINFFRGTRIYINNNVLFTLLVIGCSVIGGILFKRFTEAFADVL